MQKTTIYKRKWRKDDTIIKKRANLWKKVEKARNALLTLYVKK